jgi:predicted deacetylase
LPVVATPSLSRNSLVVSIHDIAPSNRLVVEQIIHALAPNGIRACSLLVVPDYHHEGRASEDRQFVSWLCDLDQAGHEIVIHGYFHQRERRAHETIRTQFLTQCYTQNEGEFYDLDYNEALRRIMAARDEFRAIGLKPRGFVAPAWLLGADAERAAHDADLEYTTRLRTVHDLRSGEDFPAQSIVYSVRNQWRRAVSRGWNATLFRVLKGRPLLRVSIHPPDFSHPAIWRQVVDLIKNAVPDRTVTTYQDWVAEQRLRRRI